VPIYSAEGLAVSYDTETKSESDPIMSGDIRIVAHVSHAGGHTRRYHIDLPLDDVGSGGKVNKTKIQARGSTNEYGRRYLARMIFNLATRDDTDGNGNGEDRTAAVVPPKGDGLAPFYQDTDFARNLPAWKKLMDDRKKTVDDIIKTVTSKHRLTDLQLQKLRAAAPTA
jgi:hypothetical protein